MAKYNSRHPTILSADASSFDLRVLVLEQRTGKCQPIAFASRFLTKAEMRYAGIEKKKKLALTWVAERLRMYMRVLNVTFENGS